MRRGTCQGRAGYTGDLAGAISESDIRVRCDAMRELADEALDD